MKRKNIVCRVCLECDLDTENVSNIFEENDKVFIYEKNNTIAKLHIKPKDGLPDTICGDCLLELENAINFKQKCETSNSILVSAVNTGIGPTQEDEDPLDTVKSEPEEHDDQDYLEEDVSSPPEVPIKPDPDPQLGETDLHTTPARTSKTIDLQLECHDCGGSFTSKCKLKVHWKRVHLKEQLTCPICLTTFGSLKKRNEHDVKKTRKCKIYSQVNVTGERKHRMLHCRECEYSTAHINNMTSHIVKHTGERKYACTLCPKQYTQFVGLQGHMESVHGMKKQRLCKICGELITGKHKYDRHLKRHREFNVYETCKICNRKIKKGGIKQHMAVHTNVRPFSCDKCAARFKLLTGLFNHDRRVHRMIKYKCDKCEYSTKNNNSLKKHKSRHTGNDFPCTECGKFFENDLQLSLHIQKHTNKDHKCPLCASSFFRRRGLLTHIKKIHKTYLV